jgi:Bifunctional DNA primase/polymerase, N-terminal
MRRIPAEALRLVTAGLSVIPIAADGTKRPVIAWKPYQSRPPTSEELTRWFQEGDVGIAIIGGKISGNLEILDFDAPETFAPWSTMVAELSPDLPYRLPVVPTPTEGRHVYYRCPLIGGNQKLAQCLNADGRPETLIETRGEGGYAITPPSPPACHPLNKPYILLHGDLAAIPTFTPEERTILLNAARSFNEHVEPKRVIFGGASPGPSQPKGGRPGDIFNAQAEWSNILEPQGWTRIGQRGEITLWKRPGKWEHGCSATTNYAGSDLLYVFSANAHPFEPQNAYTKFAAYALLEHGGDFEAAAKCLAAKGLGSQSHLKGSLHGWNARIQRQRAVVLG